MDFLKGMSQGQLDSILQILNETRLIKEEERRLKEAQVEILRLERLPANPQVIDMRGGVQSFITSTATFNPHLLTPKDFSGTFLVDPLIDPLNPLSLTKMVDDLNFDPSSLVNFDDHALSIPPTAASRSINPEDVFRQAAAKGRKNTTTLEEQCSCSTCNSNLGTIFLRGKQSSFETPYTIDVTCKACSLPLSSSSNPSSSKKRNRTIPNVECDSCRVHLGIGGARVMAPAGHHGWDEPAFIVEVVCPPCSKSFLFCQWCGGTRSKRTGKWRPKKMFINGRRTCSLPHIRIGSTSKLVYRTLQILPATSPISSSLISAVKDVFWDSLLSLMAVPPLDRYNGEYDNLVRDIDAQWGRVVDLLNGVGYQTALNTHPRYLTIAWINKEKKSKLSDSQLINAGVPWLARLAIEGTVAPQEQPVGADAVVDMLGENEGGTRCFASFGISEWDQERRSLCILKMAPRSEFSSVVDSYGEVILKSVERVQADCRRDGASQGVDHIWMWTGVDEHARVQSIPDRLGFRNRADYISGLGDSRIGDDAFRGPEGCIVWVVSVKELRRKSEEVRKRLKVKG